MQGVVSITLLLEELATIPAMATTSESLDVIGLISGGKDSFFSLLHCMANNHRVIALANLYPPSRASSSDAPEDLNSFMYQTAGHRIIPLYSEALGLPLYRQEIQGSASNLSKDYHPDSGIRVARDPGSLDQHPDETESLIPLLRRIMSAHPTANALSSGAILSTYQRTRIESVARRLGLTPLSFLWHYPFLPPPLPGGLLDDMAAAGFDVRIVKVASGGLDEDLLWENLMDPLVRKKVQKGVGRFGGSVLGEGGEYETLVVDGLSPLWRRRIEMRASERWIEKGGGGEAWISCAEDSGKLVRKEEETPAEGSEWNRGVRIPDLWDAEFLKLVKKIAAVSLQQTHRIKAHSASRNQIGWEAATAVSESSSMLRIHNINAPQAGTLANEQMSAINLQVLEILEENDLPSIDHIIFTTILLRQMADFNVVNATYGQLFDRPNPPARVTVACGEFMPLGVHVMVSFVICLDRRLRDGLHVQSRSYWAPANIGPYSQAVSVPLQSNNMDPRVVYIAGQIPLIPASMEVLLNERDTGRRTSERNIEVFQKRACLGLQHLWRIGETMKVNWWTAAVAFIVGGDDVHAKALVAWECWHEVHQAQLWEADGQDADDSDINGLDVWDRKYGGMGSFVNDDSEGRHLPDFKRSSNPESKSVPPFFAVQVDALPRSCDIEWHSSGMAYSDLATPTVQSPCSHIAMSLSEASSDHDFRTQIREISSKIQEVEDFDATVYTSQPWLVRDIEAQVIPCKSVWGPAGKELAAGIVIRNGA